MGSKCSRCITSCKQRNDRRCLLLGFDNAGKTCILYSLAKKDQRTTIPTVGFNVETVKRKHYKYDIWDVGGQEQLRTMWRHYYTGTDAVIYVVDASDKERLPQVKEEILKLSQNDQLSEAIWVFLLNKQDLPNAVKTAEFESLISISSLMEGRKYSIFESVAVNNIGFDDGISWIDETLKDMN